MRPHSFSTKGGSQSAMQGADGDDGPDEAEGEKAQLPENAKAYIRFLEEQIEAPIDIISTGPDRVETITLRHPFGE